MCLGLENKVAMRRLLSLIQKRYQQGLCPLCDISESVFTELHSFSTRLKNGTREGSEGKTLYFWALQAGDRNG